MKFNSQGTGEVTYDAIVIGSGISGGYAAMELCKKGYKVLMLERGRMVKHNDYPRRTLIPGSWSTRTLYPVRRSPPTTTSRTG